MEKAQVLEIYYYILCPNTAAFTYLPKTILCVDSALFFLHWSYSHCIISIQKFIWSLAILTDILNTAFSKKSFVP